MSNLISTSSIASGSIIYPEHVLRSIQALRGETDTLFILSGSLVVSASDVRYPNLLENPTPTALLAFNTSSGNLYWTENQSSISPSSFIATGSVDGNVLTFTKGDSTTFDLTVSATASSATSLVTASISGTTLTFTKGDTSNFNLNIASSSFAAKASSSLQATTASYATVAQTLLGSVVSASRALSASNADLLDNLEATAFVLNSQTSSMTVLSASYASNVSSSLTSVSSSYAVTASYALNAGGSGGPEMYQVVLNIIGGAIDTGGTPIASVIGPNGENKTTLEGLGWSFTCPTTSRLDIGRPSSKQVQPLFNMMTHGNKDGNVLSRVPSATSTAGYSAYQTLSGAAFVSASFYGLTASNTGYKSSGTTTLSITFGLIS